MISLSDLISQIGISVQNANAAIEQVALAAYLGQGYDRAFNQEMSQEEFTPISYTLHIPTPAGKKQINVPVTALMHHTSLKLEQVDVKLKFQIEKSEEDTIYVSVKPSVNPEESVMNELSLQFKSSPPAEGMARIDQHQVQVL